MTMARWDQVAEFMALLANCHRIHKEQPTPFTRDQFHPWRRAVREVAVEVELGDLKGLFVK